MVVAKLKRHKIAAPDRKSYPAGAVMMPCSDLARYHQFTNDMILLDVPDGTSMLMYRSSSIVQNMNMMVAELLAHDGQWAWIIGDDHAFKRDTVLRLLAHDVDIVAPLCSRRGPPFPLVSFDEERDLDDHGRQLYHMIEYNDLPDHGLVEVVATGTAGMLVKRHVFEEIGDPWFQNSDGITTNEDMEFCRKAREAGFKVMLDVDTAIGHIGVFTVVPERRGNQWGLTLDFGGQGSNNIFFAGGIGSGDPGAPDARVGTHDWQRADSDNGVR